jgi:hypothetical protein
MRYKKNARVSKCRNKYATRTRVRIIIAQVNHNTNTQGIRHLSPCTHDRIYYNALGKKYIRIARYICMVALASSGDLGRVGNAKSTEDIAVAVLTINHPNGSRDLC